MLSGSDEDRVRVRCRFIRQGCDVEATEQYVGPARTIAVGDLVRPIGVGDVDLNDHEIRLVVEVDLLDVLILQRDLEVRIEVRSERSQAKGWKERVLDRPPSGTRGLRQRREDELHAPD